MKNKWRVKIDLCTEGSSCATLTGMTYLYFPQARVETSRILTEDERREINDAIVKAAAKELTRIAEGGEE